MFSLDMRGAVTIRGFLSGRRQYLVPGYADGAEWLGLGGILFVGWFATGGYGLGVYWLGLFCVGGVVSGLFSVGVGGVVVVWVG